MHTEIQVTIEFITSFLHNKVPRNVINTLAVTMNAKIVEKFTGHWYPDKPSKGSAYRCLTIGSNKCDTLFQESASAAGLSISEFRAHYTNDISIWIDPGEVYYRVGDSHHSKPLFTASRSSSNNSLPSSSIFEPSPNQAAALLHHQNRYQHSQHKGNNFEQQHQQHQHNNTIFHHSHHHPHLSSHIRNNNKTSQYLTNQTQRSSGIMNGASVNSSQTPTPHFFGGSSSSPSSPHIPRYNNNNHKAMHASNSAVARNLLAPSSSPMEFGHCSFLRSAHHNPSTFGVRNAEANSSNSVFKPIPFVPSNNNDVNNNNTVGPNEFVSRQNLASFIANNNNGSRLHEFPTQHKNLHSPLQSHYFNQQPANNFSTKMPPSNEQFFASTNNKFSNIHSHHSTSALLLNANTNNFSRQQQQHHIHALKNPHESSDYPLSEFYPSHEHHHLINSSSPSVIPVLSSSAPLSPTNNTLYYDITASMSSATLTSASSPSFTSSSPSAAYPLSALDNANNGTTPSMYHSDSSGLFYVDNEDMLTSQGLMLSTPAAPGSGQIELPPLEATYYDIEAQIANHKLLKNNLSTNSNHSPIHTNSAYSEEDLATHFIDMPPTTSLLDSYNFPQPPEQYVPPSTYYTYEENGALYTFSNEMIKSFDMGVAISEDAHSSSSSTTPTSSSSSSSSQQQQHIMVAN